MENHAGCGRFDWSDRLQQHAKSAVIGGASGAAIGAATTGKAGGALVGGAVGAAAGALVGRATEPGKCIYRDSYGREYVAACR